MSFRLVLRSLRRAPGFTAFTLLVFALGISLTTVAFFVLNTVLFRPLDLPSPDQLVQIRPLDTRTGKSGNSVPGLDFRDLAQQAHAFQAMAAYQAGRTTVLVGDHAEQVRLAAVSPGWHETLGLQPILGRGLFAHGIEESGALVSYGFWQSRLGGDSGVLQRSVHVEGKLYPICGVMPPGGVFPEKTDVWIPKWPDRDGSTRTAFNYRVLGRLKQSISPEAGKASLAAVAAGLEKQYPRENAHRSYTLVDLREQLVGSYRAMLWTLSGAVLVVLMMACVNVTNLLLARAVARQRDLAIRMALGAGMRQLLTTVMSESLLLAAAGGAGGLLLAIWLRDLLITQIPFPIPRLAQGNVDLTVVGFAVLASLACGVVTGLLPAWRLWRAEVQDVLVHTGSSKVTASGQGMRSGLLVAEVAFSVLLLVGAGLLLRSFARLASVDPGFRVDNLLVMEADLTAVGENGSAERAGFYEELQQRASALPGVTGAAWNRDIPVRETDQSGAVFLEGRAAPAPGEMERLYAGWHIIGPGFFSALRVPLRQGREFSPGDNAAAPDVAVVNEAFVRTFFPDGQSPLGHHFKIGLDRVDPITIVGVVSNTRPLSSPAGPELYLPYPQHLGSSGRLYLTMRVQGNTTPVTEALRQLSASRMPEAAIRFTSMQQAVSDSIATSRFRTLILSLFAGIALALALIGLYGVISYVVQARTREIGLRMALGAQTSDVLSQFLGRGLQLTAVGLLIGMAAAFFLRHLVAGFLFDTPASDGWTYAGTAILLLGSALLACFVPAWRASRQDPAQVLRQE